MLEHIGKLLEENVQKLIELKIIKSKEELEDLPLDAVEKIAHEIGVCPRDLVIYLTCGGDCDNCTKEYKIDCENIC